MKNFDGKSALITGGSSGIGLAMAEILASQGAHISLLARDPDRLNTARQRVMDARRSKSQQIRVLAADVADYNQLSSVLLPALDAFGTPDLLVNSAGITYPGLFAQLDLEIHRQNMEINYFGTLHTTRMIVNGMIQRGSGHIVNISSLVGIHGLYGYSAYSPSKFAVRGLSDVLRYELKPHGIQVSVVFPSDTQTPQLEFEKDLKPPALKALVDSSTKPFPAEVVAQKIITGIRKGKYLILPSSDSVLLFWVYSLFPGHGLYWLVDRLMDAAYRKTTKDLAGK